MVYTLTIRERAHPWAGRPAIQTAHPTRAEAEAELLTYVRRNWAAEIGTDEPDDPDEMIAQHSDEVLETHEISGS
jgi:hypothetical protein